MAGLPAGPLWARAMQTAGRDQRADSAAVLQPPLLINNPKAHGAGALGVGAGQGAPLTLSPGALAAVVVTCVLLGLVLAVGVALLVQRR